MESRFNIRHAKACEYVCSGHDLWIDCTCAAKFGGKPFRHWQQMAREHVVETLLRGALQHTDDMSLPGMLAKAKLLGLVSDLDSELRDKILDQRDRMMENFALIFNEALNRWPHVRDALGFPNNK